VREPTLGLSKCRNCGREVVLARTVPNRSVMRVDLVPSEVGTYILEHAEGVQWATHWRRRPDYTGPLWTYHGVTCPTPPARAAKKRRRPEQAQLGFWVPRGNR
jgi:hypothetical protein